MGSNAEFTSTLPFASFVNPKNQSVQGATKYMMRPTKTASELSTKVLAIIKAKEGIMMKLATHAIDKYFLFLTPWRYLSKDIL